MNLKFLLMLGVVSSPIINFSHITYAEDYVAKSQINVANGVAGLNKNGEITANVNNDRINNNSINSNFIQLNKKNDRLRFITNSPDTNNNEIDMFYNADGDNKDDFGNPLEGNTFYFTNNKYGNNYRFNGTVKASSFNSGHFELPRHGDRLRFITNSPDTNNNMIDMFYNLDGNNKDDFGNPLEGNTFYFTNNKYGNNYRFNGTVKAGGIEINGHVLNKPIPGGIEPVDPYNDDRNNANLIFLSQPGYDWGNIKPNTLMVGGRSRNSVVGIKATCQNTGQGDQGGSCYQFTNMSGPQAYHRSGSGVTDGINMDMRTMDNSPMDSIGGNTLVKNSDGSYIVKGNEYSVISNVPAGATKFVIKGTFGCGLGESRSRCELRGINFVNNAGKISNSVKVTPGFYNPSNNTTEVNINDGYALKDILTPDKKLEIIYYASDGTAYAIDFSEDDNGSQYAAIYPSLSEKERNLTHARMAVWTNIANGMASVENGTNEDSGNTDMPGYYYGYADGFGDTVLNQANIDAIQADKTKTDEEKDLAIRQNKVTKIFMRSFSYPGLAGDLVKWKNNKHPLNDDPNLKSPGLNVNDQLDYKLSYACLTKNQLNDNEELQKRLHIGNRPDCFDKVNIPAVVRPEQINNINYIYNSNYHRYQKPALFLGMVQKNFNLYTQQSFNKSPDSITREFDNEWDFPMNQDHDGQASVRGLTMVFSGGGHPLAQGSYMLRMAGFNHMPLGLKIDGIWPYGGKSLETDAGFFLYKWTMLGASPYLQNINDVMSISGLGQIKTNQASYQLMTFMSNDGNVDNKRNNSLHLGLTKQNSTDPLQNLAWNQSPTCNENKECAVLGQIFFDPLGYIGGIGLGSGYGDKAKLGLVVDKDANVFINKNLSVTGQSNNNSINTNFLQLNHKNNILRFVTNSPDTNNNMIDMFYNRDGDNRDDFGNLLESNTFYFTNNRYGNNYRFNGTVKANSMESDQFTARGSISSRRFIGLLSTPSSSSASCTTGEFTDDANYHYVCVSTNKWKRVALSDF